jgi:hypothetical protein
VADEPIFSRAKKKGVHGEELAKNPTPGGERKKEDGGAVDQHREKDSVEDEPIFARAKRNPKQRQTGRQREDAGLVERGPIKTFEDREEEMRNQEAGGKEGGNAVTSVGHGDGGGDGSPAGNKQTATVTHASMSEYMPCWACQFFPP